MEYRALILDDHPLVANSIGDIMRHAGLFSVIEVCHTEKDFLALANPYDYHCYMVDISLGETDGRTLIKAIRKHNTKAVIITVSSHDHARVIQSSLKAGADSFLLKSSSIPMISECVQRLMSGEEYIPQNIQKILTNYMKGKSIESNTTFPDLTSREAEILQLLTEEFTSKEIAEKLFISEHTVESHRASLFVKFDVRNIAGLVRKAIISGLAE